jgi:prepilin-type N-terminal cleavage/methylation domain-containing protein
MRGGLGRRGGLRQRGGFTLIEVMAALLVFSAGVLMMLGVTRALGQSLERSAINSLITADGQERMDSLMSVGFTSLSGNYADTLTYRGVQYRLTHSVTLYSPLVKRILVTVEPLAGDPGPSFDVVSYLADEW